MGGEGKEEALDESKTSRALQGWVRAWRRTSRPRAQRHYTSGLRARSQGAQVHRPRRMLIKCLVSRPLSRLRLACYFARTQPRPSCHRARTQPRPSSPSSNSIRQSTNDPDHAKQRSIVSSAPPTTLPLARTLANSLLPRLRRVNARLDFDSRAVTAVAIISDRLRTSPSARCQPCPQHS